MELPVTSPEPLSPFGRASAEVSSPSSVTPSSTASAETTEVAQVDEVITHDYIAKLFYETSACWNRRSLALLESYCHPPKEFQLAKVNK